MECAEEQRTPHRTVQSADTAAHMAWQWNVPRNKERPGLKVVDATIEVATKSF